MAGRCPFSHTGFDWLCSLPLTDPSQRAVPLSPSEWRDALQESKGGLQGCLGKQKTIILDVRNKYEFEVGRFQGE